MTLSSLIEFVIDNGEKLPKKHGSWYRVHAYDDNYLILDTWNGYLYHYPDGAKEHDLNNMYRCIYSFRDSKGSPDNYERVTENMAGFWYGHIYYKTNRE